MHKRLPYAKILILTAIVLAMASVTAFAVAPETEEVAADPDPGVGWEKCGDSLWYKIEGDVNKKLYFYGSGAMRDYDDGSGWVPAPGEGAPWHDPGIKEVIWTSDHCDITRIGGSAFVGCEGLTSMHWSNDAKVEGEAIVPGSVTSVGKFGFYHNNGLTKITFASGSKVSFDRYSMSGMESLEEIVINKASSLPTIYPWADYCHNLTKLTINGNTSFDFQTFNGSSNLKTIEIGPDVTSVNGLRTTYYAMEIDNYIVDPGNGTYLLDDGVLLRKSGSDLTVVAAPMNKEYYYMSDDVTKIGDGAFQSSSIKNLHISNKVTTIEAKAFLRAGSLQTVLLPDSCTYVGLAAFNQCTSLKTIHFGTGLKTMWAESFEYSGIDKFDNNGKKVQINYDSSWVNHQLTDQEIGYLKNTTFTKDGTTMKSTGNR